MKYEAGILQARQMAPHLTRNDYISISIKDQDLLDHPTEEIAEPETIDLESEEEPEKEIGAEKITRKNIMRFYDDTGICVCCDTPYHSRSEVKKH